MRNELKIYCDVGHDGSFRGQHSHNIIAKIQDQFAGQMVCIQVTGIERDERSMRAWYFSGIIPDFLGVMRALGNHDINPKNNEQRNEAHQMFMKKFLSPLTDELGNLIDKKGKPSLVPVYSTKGLGRSGWQTYLDDIVNSIYETYGVRLKPNRTKSKNDER